MSFKKDFFNEEDGLYTIRLDGKIKVTNKGYNYKRNKWMESVGKAKPVSDPAEENLMVSFFRPFYSGFNVIAVDKEYKNALVTGKSKDYLRLLCREKPMPEDAKSHYLAPAISMGFNTNKFIWVKYD